MQKLIQTQNGNVFSTNIKESHTVLDLKKQVQKMINVNFQDIILIYGNNILNDYSTIKSYSIHNNSLITAFKKTNGGIIQCIKPSPPIGDVYNRVYPSLLPKGKLSNQFFKITNATHAYFQRNSDCYAYAGTSAFINTCLRIHGLKDYVPSFDDCYKEACYEKENGGNVSKAINLIEKKFPRGIRCEERDNITIQDVLTLSVVVSFSTSKTGWNNVANGDLLTFPIGEADDFHAALVEGYDLDLDCFICKNSWGGLSSQPRFNFCPSATHWHKFTVVYFTEESIKGKTDKQYRPRMEKFIGKLKNKRIHCAWMDLITATYDMNYVCEFHPEKKGDLQYLGYKIDEWIEINLNRKKGQKYPDTYIYNTLKKNEYRYLLEIIQNNDLLERIENEVPEPKSLIEIKYHQIFKIPIPFPNHEVPKLQLRPFLGGKLTKRFIRNSNIPTPYIYHQTPIYAYVAAYSYIDTIYRIYGVENIPTFDECLKIACYCGTQNGSALKAIKLLEDHFNFGIQCCITDDITPRDAITLSIIAKITTCDEGWENIKKGEFFEYVEGDNEKTGYSLVKGYDFRYKCLICKNLNNEFEEKPFFNYKCRAAIKSKFIVVYFTLDNINRDYIIKEYKPKMCKFVGLLKFKQINCAWMDENTAKFETNYVIQYHPEKKGKLKYLGYEIDDWIEIMSTPCYLLHNPNCLLI